MCDSGQIELFYDRGNHHEFLTQLKELARHGDLIKNTSYPFEFPNVEKPYEVYTGSNVRLRFAFIFHSLSSFLLSLLFFFSSFSSIIKDIFSVSLLCDVLVMLYVKLT
jgi:Vacuolar protein sorting-associated protein 26